MRDPQSPYDIPYADLARESDEALIDLVMTLLFLIGAYFIVKFTLDKQNKEQNEKTKEKENEKTTISKTN